MGQVAPNARLEAAYLLEARSLDDSRVDLDALWRRPQPRNAGQEALDFGGSSFVFLVREIFQSKLIGHCFQPGLFDDQSSIADEQR